MISYSDIEGITKSLHNIIALPTISIRQHKFKRLKNTYPKQLDYLLSMMFELPKLNITLPQFNTITTYDFKDDFGIVFYNVLYDRKFSDEYYALPYQLQKLIRLLLSKYLIQSLGEQFLLLIIEHYYKLPELIIEVNLPDVIEKADIGLQGLKKDRIKYTTFPLYVYKLNKRQKPKGIRYMLKKNGQVISNIKSGVIREALLKEYKDTDFGIIGLQTTLKGYKRKYDFIPLYFSKDPDNVKHIYQNKETEYKNEIELTKLETEKDFKKFVKSIKHKNRVVVLSKNGVELFNPDIKYAIVPVIDYLYDDNFNIKGLVVKYKDTYHNIYLDINDTHYADTIENKFVKVVVTYYKDTLLSVKYNSIINQWSRYYTECRICGKADSKHYSNGICYACKYKLDKYPERLGRLGSFTCDKDFELETDLLYFHSSNGVVNIEPVVKPYQQLLPFDKVDFCSYMEREEKLFRS